jgi:hypothetical protein
MKLIDHLLRKMGLMRTSQAPRIEISSEGCIKVELKNGFRWSGHQDRHHLAKISYPDIFALDEMENRGK